MQYDPNATVLDSAFRRDTYLTIKVNEPMKRALVELAAQNGVSVSDILRGRIVEDIARRYPNFVPLYERFKQEDMYGEQRVQYSISKESNDVR